MGKIAQSFNHDRLSWFTCQIRAAARESLSRVRQPLPYGHGSLWMNGAGIWVATGARIWSRINGMKISSLAGLFFFATSWTCAAVRSASVADARAFLDAAEAKLLALSVDSGRSDWVKDNFITDDTEILAAEADERVINATVELVKQSKRFDGLKLPADLARKMKLLRLSVTVATPSDPKESAE